MKKYSPDAQQAHGDDERQKAPLHSAKTLTLRKRCALKPARRSAGTRSLTYAPRDDGARRHPERDVERRGDSHERDADGARPPHDPGTMPTEACPKRYRQEQLGAL